MCETRGQKYLQTFEEMKDGHCGWDVKGREE